MQARIIDALNTRFATHFTPDGESWLYRTGSGASPARISAKDREFLIDGFYDRTNWLATGLILAIGLALVGIYLIVAYPGSHPQEAWRFWFVYVAVATLALALSWLDLWDYPRRTLFEREIEAGRAPRNWFVRASYQTGWFQLMTFAFITRPRNEGD